MNIGIKNYVIGVGGSGIRVLRAIVHNCAAGIMDINEINMLAIDADFDSKVWKNFKKEYEDYENMREILLDDKEKTFFSTSLILRNKDEMLSPIRYTQKLNSLETSIGSNVELSRVMKFFYKKEEREKDLKEGFFARPGIGCVFFSNFQNNTFNELLSELENNMNKGIQSNIILVGSIFGGTGASGIPTIKKLIEEKFRLSNKQQVKENAQKILNVSAVFVLPYFKATNYSEAQAMIKMQKFWKTASEAMEYYKEEGFLEDGSDSSLRSFQRLYLIGKKELDVVNYYAEGGEQQDNKPHIVEEYGALAVSHFFQKACDEAFDRKLQIYKCELENEIYWEQLSFKGDKQFQDVRYRMGKFAQFATIYHTCIYRYKGNGIETVQWHKTYLSNYSNGNTETQLKQINEYSRDFLKWIYYIQNNLDI